MSTASSSASIVTLHSKLTAVSSKPFGSGKTHRLSGLDHAMGCHTVHIIWYYKDEDNLFRCFDLDCLRESLSEVLSMYPTMTGRLARGQDGNWQVRCNDAGVRVIQATVGTTLPQWLASASASASQEALLIHWEHMSHDPPTTWSPFVIQISSFQGGGVAVGLSCNHMLADLTCAASFFKSWAQTHRHVPITNQPSFTPLHAASPSPSPVPNGDANSPPSVSVSPTEASLKNMAKATFKFSGSIIKQCLSKVHDMCPNATPFDFLSALFWTRIVHLKPPKNHDDQTHSLSICTDFRRFLKKSPRPLGYFGNALHFSNLSLNVKDHMDSDKLGVVVSEVHRHLEGIEEEEIWSSIERFESQKESSERGKFISPSCMYGPELTCFCMEHLIEDGKGEPLLYEAVFSNDEKPAHVSCHVGNVVGEGLIMVVPSSEGGFARTVMVMLPQEELAELSKDQAILQLQQTSLFTDIVAEL